MKTLSIRHAPHGQYRVLAIDRDTGEETVERDCWFDVDSIDYLHEHGDDRLRITLRIYNDHGEEIRV